MPIHAIWNNHTLASTDDYKIVEGDYYFPFNHVVKEYFIANGNKHDSRWKGVATMYDVTVQGKTLSDAAWLYEHPEKEVEGIKNFVTFSDDVVVEKIEYGPKGLTRQGS